MYKADAKDTCFNPHFVGRIYSSNANYWQISASNAETQSSIYNIIPNITVSASPGGVGLSSSFGGANIAAVHSAVARWNQAMATSMTIEASQASKMASYIRREQEWVLQANLASREIIQIDKQITASDIRIQIAEKELHNHLKQIENANEVEQFLRDKFSNKELYQWMKDQLFKVYRQSYQLAYDMAKKAEKAFRFETGRTDTNFVQYGYWDASYQGLASGERLHLAIKQMEKSYIEDNRREFELTKHISVAMLNPYTLMQLKNTGSCELELHEELFDLDYPGHYFRRIKSVSISIPCLAGPYTTVNCTLRLLKNKIRINTVTGEGYEHKTQDEVPIDDDRFMENNIPCKSIATSSAQNDSGVFELNFRDERYLPFEGAGVISTWKIELNGKYLIDGNFIDLSQFDYNTLSDIIIHMKYTAREDSGQFRAKAVNHLKSYLSKEIENAGEPFMRLFSLKYEFPETFQKLLSEDQRSTFEIKKSHFNYLFTNREILAKNVRLFIRPKSNQTISAPDINLKFNELQADSWVKVFNSELLSSKLSKGDFDPIAKWSLQNGNKMLSNQNVDDILILIDYSTGEPI